MTSAWWISSDGHGCVFNGFEQKTQMLYFSFCFTVTKSKTCAFALASSQMRSVHLVLVFFLSSYFCCSHGCRCLDSWPLCHWHIDIYIQRKSPSVYLSPQKRNQSWRGWVQYKFTHGVSLPVHTLTPWLDRVTGQACQSLNKCYLTVSEKFLRFQYLKHMQIVIGHLSSLTDHLVNHAKHCCPSQHCSLDHSNKFQFVCILL